MIPIIRLSLLLFVVLDWGMGGGGGGLVFFLFKGGYHQVERVCLSPLFQGHVRLKLDKWKAELARGRTYFQCH